MLHIYTGDAKGKTTAAVGLAIRAAGAGKKVLFFQFLKSDTSSERCILKKIDNIYVKDICTAVPFLCSADDSKIEELKNAYNAFVEYLESEALLYDVIILDEAVCAVCEGFVDIKSILDISENKEVIMTGRGDISAFSDKADYITEMKKVKHPYDKGVLARKGIEY